MRPEPGYLLAIDPGLDRVAVSSFDLRRARALIEGCLTRGGDASQHARFSWFRDDLIDTSPKMDETSRIALIGERVAALVRAAGPCEVLVELPSTYGAYRRQAGRNNERSLALLQRAIGAIQGAAAAAGAQVLGMEADTAPKSFPGDPAWLLRHPGKKPAAGERTKQWRACLVRQLWGAQRIGQDLLDARWLGVRWITQMATITQLWVPARAAVVDGTNTHAILA